MTPNVLLSKQIDGTAPECVSWLGYPSFSCGGCSFSRNHESLTLGSRKSSCEIFRCFMSLLYHRTFRHLNIADFLVCDISPRFCLQISACRFNCYISLSSQSLQDFYAPYNKKLYTLIGRDFEWENRQFKG